MADPVIEEVKRRTDIVDLVAAKVGLKKSGRQFRGLCPFHREKTPSFFVYPENGTYYCFGCQASGDVFTWLIETQKLGFGEALRELAGRAGVALPERRPAAEATAEEERAQRLTDALRAASERLHRCLLEEPGAAHVRAYIASRGISDDAVRRFQLGFALDRWDALTKELVASGQALQDLFDAGLAVQDERGAHDRFRGRLMFPIRDVRGDVRGFGGRVLTGDAQPKYLNSPQTALFDKSALLYGLDLAAPAIRRADQAIIVEGYTDVIIAHQHGFQNVVASMGTALTERQLGLLKRYSGNVLLALDADAAGTLATERGVQLVQETLDTEVVPVVALGIRGLIRYASVLSGEVRVAALPSGQDPDEVIRADPALWRQAIEEAPPLVEYALQSVLAQTDLTTARAKSAAAQKVLPLIAAIPDPVEQGHYLGRLSLALAVSERDLRAEMRRRPRRRTGPASASRKPDDEAQPQPDSPAGEPLEDHILSLLLLAPDFVDRVSARLSPAEFWRPEAREVFRALSQQSSPPQHERAEAEVGESLRTSLDDALRPYYDQLATQASRHPPFTPSQLEADLTQVALRLRERNLRERLRQAQLLLRGAAPNGDAEERTPGAEAVTERRALRQLVKELSDELMRVQLAQSRPPVYSSAPA